MARKKKNGNHPPQITSGFTEWADLPTRYHHFRAAVWVDQDKAEHLTLVKGRVAGKKEILVRVQSECMTGDVFGSKRCDCYAQLQKSLELIEKRGEGVVIYLRQEGRGIGLANKIRAYHLQDEGFDTIEANHQLGLPVDARHYGAAADILKEIKVKSLKLLTNNPQKLAELREAGLRVRREPLIIRPNRYNKRYLTAKRRIFRKK